MDEKKIGSALISVYQKDGLEEVARYLHSKGVVIYSTGGTEEFISSLGIPVVSVESLTGFPEMLGGRVKTLHPMVFGGILNRRSDKKDKKDVAKHSIKPIDLVIVDLYPFEETVADEQASHEDIIEKIDIGGVSLIRAAAKNYQDVLVVSDRSHYGALLELLGDSCSSDVEAREEFAIEAFAKTSRYDQEIFKYILGEELSAPQQAPEAPKGGLSLSVTKDDYTLNDFIYCWDKFGERPNRVVIHNTYSSKLFAKLMEERILDKNVFTEVIPDSVEVIINDKILAKLDEACYISYIVADRNMDNSFIDSITFYYKRGYDKIDGIIGDLNDCILDYCEEDSNKLNTIVLSASAGLELEPISIKEDQHDDIELFYSSETFKHAEKAIKAIKKADRGLTILYGSRGTGKTSMIGYMASKLDRIAIYVPGSMVDHTINNPEFRKFAKKYERPLLFIDDCESLVGDTYIRQSPFAANVLQLVDGFLSESVNANVVMIFNEEDEDSIDPSLLDCNGLLEVVEFSHLSEAEAGELAKHLGRKPAKGGARMIDVVKKRKSSAEYEIGF